MKMETEFYTILERAVSKAMNGENGDIEELLALAAEIEAAPGREERQRRLDALCDGADRVRRHHCGNAVETCSIVNGRSGRCSENCKWCAQSAAHSTGCDEYLLIDREEFLKACRSNARHGVERISIVCSGRKVALGDIRKFCGMYRQGAAETGIGLCASMGLLNRAELQELYDAGIRRYHCNLETSARFFPTLCTSHTREDKLETIRLAREVGMEVCSGGIIGMGETLRDRLELAAEARDAGACSLPLNLLNPIPGTPLADTPLLGEEEAILSAALMRLTAPKLSIRFAGGRRRISREATLRMLRGGVNGALVGDMLTTVGNDIDNDFRLFRETL